MIDQVAVLGLGAMGLPMAARLAETWQVHGFDVAPGRKQAAEQEGVSPAATAADAVSRASHVVIAVRDAAQMEAVLFGPEGAASRLAPESVVILTSTVGAGPVTDTARRLADQGVATVDAPVSGGAVRARVGELLIMAGGDRAALAKADPVLAALATNVVVTGKVGDGQNMKAVNQLLCGVHTAAAAEALALARSLGLDLDQCVEVLGQGAAASFMLQDRGPRMVEQLSGRHPELRSRVDVIAKDMGIVGEIARSHALPTPVAAAAENLYRMAKSAGLSAEDDSAVAAFLTGHSET